MLSSKKGAGFLPAGKDFTIPAPNFLPAGKPGLHLFDSSTPDRTLPQAGAAF
jgi:hypothetical protein